MQRPHETRGTATGQGVPTDITGIARRLLAGSRSVSGAAALLKEVVPRDIMLALLVAEVDAGPLAPTDVATQVGASRAIVDRWIEILRRRRLVERHDDRVALTARGRDTTAIFIEAMRTALHDAG